MHLCVNKPGSSMADGYYIYVLGAGSLADSEQFYLALPQNEMLPSGQYETTALISNQWTNVANVSNRVVNLDMIFHREMIEDIESLVSVEADRVYLSGHSDGASFAEVEMADPVM